MNKRSRLPWVVGALAVVLFALPYAHADSVKVRDLWIDNVQIQGVRDGELVFRSPTGSRTTQPLGEIRGIRVDAHPELADAQSDFDASRFAEAARDFQKVAEDARSAWLQAYARARLVEAAAAAENPMLAAEAFVELAGMSPDDALVPEPPVQAIRAAEESRKADIEQLLRRGLGDVPRERRDAVRSLIEALDEEPVAADAAVEGDGEPAEQGEVLLPTLLRADEELNQLLLAGRFDEAEALARERLKVVGGTSRELYQLGMALLGKAEQTGNPDDYKTAALPFMRVVVHFHGGSRVTDYARAEAAYCHLRFGRTDIASDMLNRARSGITEEDDAAYARRIDELIRELEASEN
ncbi:MAG: hypothetical protein ACOC1G_01090 [Phycisphaeraceae bacterium]